MNAIAWAIALAGFLIASAIRPVEAGYEAAGGFVLLVLLCGFLITSFWEAGRKG